MQTFLQDKLEKFVDKLDLANECNILAELEKNAAYKRLADEVSRILIIMGRDAILKRENYTVPYIQKLNFLFARTYKNIKIKYLEKYDTFQLSYLPLNILVLVLVSVFNPHFGHEPRVGY